VRKRVFGLVVAVIAGVALVSSAGAGNTSTQKVTRIDVSTRAAVIHYLHSIHVKAKGAVIERGLHNYAGAHCPGARWTCARTKHTVVQIAQRGGVNRFVCRSSSCSVVQLSGVSGGIYTVPGRFTSTPSPNKGGGGGGGNAATCLNPTTGVCTISQFAAGPNTAVVYENPGRKSELSQSVSFSASITQQATGTGATNGNTACVSQVMSLDASATSGSGSVAVSLDGHQSVTITQDVAGGGANSAQYAATSSGTCDTSHPLTQTQTLTSQADAPKGVTQNENATPAACPDGVTGDNANMCLDIEQNQGTGHGVASGLNTATFTQTNTLSAIADSKNGPISQTQSTVNGGLLGTINQDSTGISTATATQTENQCEDAAKGGLGSTCHTSDADAAEAPASLSQVQHGPVKKGIGTATQTSNTGDHFLITQKSTQNTDQRLGSSTQTNSLQSDCTTTGTCDSSQETNENGTSTTNTQSGNDLNTSLNCTSGSTCTPAAPPAPVIDSGPPQPTAASPDATFAFHDADSLATFLCDIGDGNGFSACPSPKTYSNLADGLHTFSVEARDNGVTSTATTYTWTVDTNVIVGNNSAFGGGPIKTYDLGTGALINSFVPDGALGGNGRAVAIQGDEIFYSELSSANSFFGPSDGIHVAPWNGGAGGHDSRVLPNPDPLKGIQDLTFSNGNLYALTGYPDGHLQAWELNPTTGAVLSGPIAIAQATPDPASDGFAVLPDGNFLINNGDASCSYQEYDSSTGQPTGQSITLPSADFSICTGVETDGTSLYFQTNFDGFTKTDLSGNVIATTTVSSNTVEDVSLVASAQVIG
jgi:hypothetical protein